MNWTPRIATAALLMVAGTASAEEFHSTTEQIVFDGVGRVIDAEYTIPFGAQLDVILAEFWIGVTVTLTGNAEFGLYVEGTSDIQWSNDDGEPGVLYHDIEPLEGSGLAAMQTDVAFNITFDVYEGSYGSNNLFVSFPLVAQDITFRLNGEPFTPFMLPGDTPNQSQINTRSRNLTFDVDLGVPIGLGDVASIEIGTNLSGWPETTAYYGGRTLQTRFGDRVVGASGRIQMEEQLAEAEMLSQYEAFVNTTIAYVFNVDLYFRINVLGLFDFPITIPIYQQPFTLFSDQVDLAFQSETYAHPLPYIVPTKPAIDMGEVEIGDADSFTFAINNDGLMDVLGLVGINGDVAFSVSPADIAAGPGGQDGVVITFEPTQAGEVNATLLLESNDPYLEYVEIPVTGVGVVPVVDPPKNDGNDNTDGFFNDGNQIYQTCGCASGALTPSGFLPLLGLVPLVALRRRKQD